jgi:hypothetical protein
MKSYTASIGSISHSTHLTVDLLSAFADELDRLETDTVIVAEARAVLTLNDAGWSDLVNSENASDLVIALQDALSEHAPLYCYFGTHEGDGSDFGFWPDLGAIEDLPKVSDPSEVENHLGEACVYVNDHGNVTVYGTDGSVIWDCV